LNGETGDMRLRRFGIRLVALLWSSNPRKKRGIEKGGIKISPPLKRWEKEHGQLGYPSFCGIPFRSSCRHSNSSEPNWTLGSSCISHSRKKSVLSSKSI